MNLTGEYGTYSRPEKQKVYTTQETADLLNTSVENIRHIVSQYQIEHEFIATKKGKYTVLTYDAFRQIENIVREKEERKAKTLKAQKERAAREALEEQLGAEEHPLVTNRRWLKLSEWPDTVPACFQECEA